MPIAAPRPQSWIRPTPAGLYCEPGDFYLDPQHPVPRAVITHGHGDHARSGNGHVLATAETIAIMQARYGEGAGGALQPFSYDENLTVGEVRVRLMPAGHVLGSAQIVLDYRGSRAVFSGDYKRRPDATCAPFEPPNCDLFITEATFGLPVFRHPPDDQEIDRLLHSLDLVPRALPSGRGLRAGEMPARLGAVAPRRLRGAGLSARPADRADGTIREVRRPARAGSPGTGVPRDALKGRIVLAPPSAAAEPWSRRLPDPLVAQASGWMRVRQRAKASGVELPLVISDHADWDELTQTLDDVAAEEIWVTHGREEALVHYATKKGYHARALALAGYEEDE